MVLVKVGQGWSRLGWKGSVRKACKFAHWYGLGLFTYLSGWEVIYSVHFEGMVPMSISGWGREVHVQYIRVLCCVYAARILGDLMFS